MIEVPGVSITYKKDVGNISLKKALMGIIKDRIGLGDTGKQKQKLNIYLKIHVQDSWPHTKQ